LYELLTFVAFIWEVNLQYVDNIIAVDRGREREYMGTQRRDTSIKEQNGMVQQ